MNTPKAINIGSIKIGNGFPVLLQSMTSTPTMDTTATVEQAIRIAEAGAHLIRITAQNTNEAHHLAVIKQELKQRGYEIPIIADIHFTPKAAEVAATIVEKVRINPGNYILKKSGQLNWSDKEYREDLDHIKTKLTS
ncbi:MAG: 1-hydroxy-2-methyl-2-(E)-butenyl 4-diphosphate synthase, partial [Bacteroidales bacterium]|nr:1-hydroxy-2-methyl-2-(E)-butenyl 4-diphosphate synthase [Bacteroidales bacterium]